LVNPTSFLGGPKSERNSSKDQSKCASGPIALQNHVSLKKGLISIQSSPTRTIASYIKNTNLENKWLQSSVKTTRIHTREKKKKKKKPLKKKMTKSMGEKNTRNN